MSYDSVVAFLDKVEVAHYAVLISVVALSWNIIRDLLVDRVRMQVGVKIGSSVKIQGVSDKHMFADMKQLEFQGIKPKRIQVLITMTNTGRRNIVIEKITAKYRLLPRLRKKVPAPYWALVTRELPKMLQPYEAHCEYSDDPTLIKELKQGYLGRLRAEDTKGKKWKVSGRVMRDVVKTARGIKE